MTTPAPAPPRDMSRVGRGSAANLGGAAVGAASAFALAVVVTRGLEPTQAGVFFSVSSLFLLAVSLGQLGTDTGLVYFLSRCRALDTPGAAAAYVRAAVRPVLVVALALGAVMFLAAPELADLTNPDHVGQATTHLRTAAWFIPLACLTAVALAATRGLGSMRAYATVEQVARPALQVLCVAVAVVLLGAGAPMAAWVLPYLPLSILAWSWWHRAAGAAGVPLAPEAPPGAGRELWRFTAPRSVASVAQLVMQRLDIVLVGAMAGAAEAALYAGATRFVVAGQMGRQAVSLAAQPALAEALSRGDRARAAEVFQVSAAWLMAVSWPLFATFAVLGEPLLAVFGPGYDAGATVLLLLAVSMLVATGCGDVDSVLIMAGRTTWSLANMLVALVLNLVLDIWLIPEHGVLGAAIGWSAAIMTKNLMALVQVRLALSLHPYGAAVGTTAVLAAGCFGAAPWLVTTALGDGPAIVAVCLAGVSGLYVALLWNRRTVLRLDFIRSLRRARRAPSA